MKRQGTVFGSHKSPAAARRDIADGMEVPYLGQGLTLRISRLSSRRRVGISKRGGTLHIQAGPHHTGKDLEAALTGWYRMEARRVMEERVRACTARMGLNFKKIFIKDQKTRWGSCSSRGNLNFNFRLVMAPPEIVEYLVVHEVCHLVYPNHSRDYWALVESYYPRLREARKWLREHGPALHGQIFS